jgi:hypothetical protein
MTTAYRNGTGAARKAFPRTPILLAPVALPFKGDYAGIVLNFNISAVRELLDHGAAGLHTLTADLQDQEAALDADTSLDDDTREARRDALWLENAQRVIVRAVHTVEWDYDDPAPDPHAVAEWGWDGAVLVWIAQIGLAQAGAQFAGPLSLQARRNTFSNIMAFLPTPPATS